ncbi:MAG: histidine--tRNA ligase [Candidatus Nanoarchaeia archaeon]|nr:histidine--tRNA ligase [Candidatus Nanoarchaeia archaeon]MDD5239102.1 histidine--tRNA ligase [Candidatus Nanoarchaeia archaeon]
MEYETPKGMRDFLPEEKILRDEVVAKLKKTFELYGFNPIETPALEDYKTCTAKFGAGEEADVLQELFALEDRAGRKLGLRFEMTFPLARVIANNPQLAKPFKRYAMGPVWRNGPIKLGRYREFWQADVDIVGTSELSSDAEMLSLAETAFKKLGLDIVIKVNNRKLLKGMMNSCNIPEKEQDSVIITIDKLNKIGLEGVKAELKEKGISTDSISKLLKLIQLKGNAKQITAMLKSELRNEIAGEGIAEINALFEYLKEFGVKSAELDVSLARGLSYYTGTIFEVFMKEGEIKSSIAAGGRWDDMIQKFANSKLPMPAVGISFGLDVICDVLKLQEKTSARKSIVSAYLVPLGTVKESIKIAQKLREGGINTDLDLTGKSISKNLEYANRQGIPYVAIIGPKELKEDSVMLKDMKKGEEKKIKTAELVKALKNK